MALWPKEPSATPTPAAPTPSAPASVSASVSTPVPTPTFAPTLKSPTTTITKETPMSAVLPVTDVRRATSEIKESLIAANVDIEGKIEGAGHVRIAGNFKGDINVQGNLTIEVGAKVTGQVRANQVHVAGELQGNI